MVIDMAVKHVQARVGAIEYEKLKRVALRRNKSLNEAIREALNEYTKKYTTIDPEDVLFTAKKFGFKERDLSTAHAKYRFKIED